VTQRHSLGATCGIESSCRAHWSLRPTGKLLFFVHGFGGEATRTWRKFPQLLLEDSRWAGWDLFYYGYDSRRVRAGVCAQLLGSQVKNVIEQSNYADAWLPTSRAADFRYNEIWFVTHSLGAVVVRQMLIEAERQNAAWLSMSHLICFAPATTGARIEKMMWLMGTTSGGLMGLVHSIFRFRWTVLDDLKIGSAFLSSLRSGTVRACRGADREPFVSRLTLFGVYEDVIEYPPAFQFDRQVRLVHGANHVEVCKPRYSNDIAYFELLNEIRP